MAFPPIEARPDSAVTASCRRALTSLRCSALSAERWAPQRTCGSGGSTREPLFSDWHYAPPRHQHNPLTPHPCRAGCRYATLALVQLHAISEPSLPVPLLVRWTLSVSGFMATGRWAKEPATRVTLRQSQAPDEEGISGLAPPSSQVKIVCSLRTSPIQRERCLMARRYSPSAHAHGPPKFYSAAIHSLRSHCRSPPLSQVTRRQLSILLSTPVPQPAMLIHCATPWTPLVPRLLTLVPTAPPPVMLHLLKTHSTQ